MSIFYFKKIYFLIHFSLFIKKKKKFIFLFETLRVEETVVTMWTMRVRPPLLVPRASIAIFIQSFSCRHGFNSSTVYTTENESQDFLYPATFYSRRKKRCWNYFFKKNHNETYKTSIRGRREESEPETA